MSYTINQLKPILIATAVLAITACTKPESRPTVVDSQNISMDCKNTQVKWRQHADKDLYNINCLEDKTYTITTDKEGSYVSLLISPIVKKDWL